MELSHDKTASKFIEESTVRAAAAGERSAMLEIYEATSDRVFRLMVRMVGAQDADDVTQQVFVKAFCKLVQFKGDSKFETWLFRLATNEALQHIRREKHRQTLELTEDPQSDLGNSREQDERAHLVRQALAALAPDLRAIFTLKEENGLSYQEIAATLQIPEGTVGSRLNRARNELRRLIEKGTSSTTLTQ